jgi:hypothetical protein
LEIDAIKHRLVTKIESIFCARQTCLRIKEYLVKYKSYHHKGILWMKLIHLDHLPKMVNKFKQEKGHKLVMKRTRKKKRNPFTNSQMSMRTITFQMGENTRKINYFHQEKVKGFREHNQL